MIGTDHHNSTKRHLGLALLSGAALALAAAGGVHTSVARASAPTCNVRWTGGGTNNLWSNPANWNTGTVPSSASDVCIATSFLSFVGATGSQSVHSLQLGHTATLILGASNTKDSMTVATLLTIAGNVNLDGSTLTAGRINNLGGIQSQGNSSVSSAALSGAGNVAAVGGKLTLVDAPLNLSGGTLTGGSWSALNGGILSLPSDITTLNATISLSRGGAIQDAKGGNALAGLSTIDRGSQLGIDDQGALSIAGNLTTQGTVILGSYASGASLTVAGSFTQLAGSSTTLQASTLTAKGVEIGSGASLEVDSGTLAGDVHNGGLLSAFGIAQATGAYTQTASGTLHVGISTHPFVVSGTATLAGTLQVYVILPPVPGTRFTAITFASRSGNFESVTLGFTTIPSSTQVDVVAMPQISVTPSSINPGQNGTVSGGDFKNQDSVAIYLDSTSGTPLQTVTASRSGSFQTTVTISAGTRTGTHTLIALGASGRTANVAFQVP